MVYKLFDDWTLFKNAENYPAKCFEQKKKQMWIKISPLQTTGHWDFGGLLEHGNLIIQGNMVSHLSLRWDVISAVFLNCVLVC